MSTAVSGNARDVDMVVAKLQSQAIAFSEVPTPAAFLTPTSAASAAVQQVAESVKYSSPRIAFTSNVTGEQAAAKVVTSADYWSTHVRP
eukprot:COSAG05_NODE_7024_length_865_cov_0.977807_1_plen_88_part_10